MLFCRQTDIKRQCLEAWKIPDDARRKPRIESPREAAPRLLGGGIQVLTDPEQPLTDLEQTFRSLYDWRAVVVGAGGDTISDRTFFVGLGRTRVFMLDKSSGYWKRVEDQNKFELSANTLVYGELVREYRGEGKSQRKAVAMHIIDALFLGGEDMRGLHFVARHEQLNLFVAVINKFSRR